MKKNLIPNPMNKLLCLFAVSLFITACSSHKVHMDGFLPHHSQHYGNPMGENTPLVVEFNYSTEDKVAQQKSSKDKSIVKMLQLKPKAKEAFELSLKEGLNLRGFAVSSLLEDSTDSEAPNTLSVDLQQVSIVRGKSFWQGRKQVQVILAVSSPELAEVRRYTSVYSAYNDEGFSGLDKSNLGGRALSNALDALLSDTKLFEALIRERPQLTSSL